MSLFSASHASYKSCGIDNILDIPANMISRDQAEVNHYLQSQVSDMDDKMASVMAGIQSLRELLTQLINQKSPPTQQSVPGLNDEMTRHHCNGDIQHLPCAQQSVHSHGGLSLSDDNSQHLDTLTRLVVASIWICWWVISQCSMKSIRRRLLPYSLVIRSFGNMSITYF